MLDWTSNPLTVLFFAVEKERDAETNDPVVWIFEHDEKQDIVQSEELSSNDSTPFDIARTKVFAPASIAHRIRAQDGWLSVHKVTENGSNGRRFVALENQPQCKEKLSKIKIKLGKLSIYRWETQLKSLGINGSTIYPD